MYTTGIDAPVNAAAAAGRNGSVPEPASARSHEEQGAPARSPEELASPTVVLTLLVSDEVDLVGPLLDYYLEQGVDSAIVTANRAPNDVLDTLRPYVDRGWARVFREDTGPFAQDRWVTRMARLAVEEHSADWVVNVDADEFFWPEGGTLKEVLAAVPPEYGVIEAPVFHFVPPQDEHGFFADRMTVRETCSLKPSGRAVFSKAIHRGVPDVEVSMGNHRVAGTGLAVLRGWQPIVGLHFPVRSWEQFERRVLRDLRADPELGGMKRYRKRLELHRDGRLHEAYEQEALSYEAIGAGLREGRLVADERLRRFFERRGAHSGESPPFDPERVAALRLATRRAAVEYARHPLAFEVDKLREELAKVVNGRRKARRGLVNAERRRDELKVEIAAIRSSLTFRLGAKLESLVAGVTRWRRPPRR